MRMRKLNMASLNNFPEFIQVVGNIAKILSQAFQALIHTSNRYRTVFALLHDIAACLTPFLYQRWER